MCHNFDTKIAQRPSFLHAVCQYSTSIAKVGKKDCTTVWMTTKQIWVCHTSLKNRITHLPSWLKHCALRYKSEGRGFNFWDGFIRHYDLGVESVWYEYRRYLKGLRVAGVKGWQAYHLHVPIVQKFWEPQPPGALRTCPGIALPLPLPQSEESLDVARADRM